MKTLETKLKPKLEEIILLIYKFRFLNRNQIQTLLNHKHHNRINIWLNQLTEEKYLKRYYSTTFAGEAAYYSLGTVGRKYLKKFKDTKKIKEQLLDRVWSEHSNSDQFKRNCMLLVDIYLSLTKLTNEVNAKLSFYTKVDLLNMKYMIRPEPSGYFSIEDSKGATKRYLLDIFDYFIPEKHYERIRKYIYYFEKRYWQDNTDKPFPEIILVCPNKGSKTFFEKTLSGKLREKGLNMSFYLSLWDEVRQQGMTKQVLQKVVLD